MCATLSNDSRAHYQPTYKMAKLKIGVSGLNDGALVAKAGTVIDQLTAHVATFATPSPAVAALTTAKNTLVAAMGAAEQGSKGAYSDLRAARKSLKDLLTQEADYVSNVANGDEGKIIDGGYEVRKQNTPAAVPPAPVMVDARVSEFTGKVDLTWHGTGARGYMVYMTDKIPETGNPVWSVVRTTTKSQTSVGNLESGKQYWFRVAALGTAGEGPASDMLMCRAA